MTKHSKHRDTEKRFITFSSVQICSVRTKQLNHVKKNFCSILKIKCKSCIEIHTIDIIVLNFLVLGYLLSVYVENS